MHNRRTNKNSYRNAALFGLTMGTAIGTSIALTRRMAWQHRMPNLKTWQQALIEKHGEVQGAFLAARTQARYKALYDERPHFTHPALRYHLEQKILPGLALYQVLSQENSNRDAVLAEVGSFLEIGSRAFSKFANTYRYLPLPFPIMRKLFKASLLAYPQQGWDIEPIEDSKTSFAFNIHRCFYLDILTVYGASELTPLYCRLDGLSRAGFNVVGVHFQGHGKSPRVGQLYSGQIRCPVFVIASTGDPLFPFDYIKRIYQQVKAPSKELLTFDLNYHLLFNECLEEVLPRLVESLKKYTEKQDIVIDSATNHSELHT